MDITNNTLCAVDISTLHIYNFAETEGQAHQVLQRAIEAAKEDITTWTGHCEKYPDTETFKNYLDEAKKKQYVIMTYEEFVEAEKKYLLDTPLLEVTEEIFDDALNVLPPLKWCTHNNVEMFCISEMWTGTYTSQYAHDKKTDKYYTKMVDICDRSTWICELLTA